MTKKAPRSRPPRLKRTKNTFEFFVRDPHGTSAINGYRRAARHFGLRTLEDATTVGTDTCRLLIHKDVRKLHAAAKALDRAYTSQDDALIDDAETWLRCESGVQWFDHDWCSWVQEQDEGTLEQLGWERVVLKSGNCYRVTLRMATRVRQR